MSNQIADLTVKKANGTTDVVYVASQPSSGDGTPAVWREPTAGTAYAHAHELRLTAKTEGKNRVLRETFFFNQVEDDITIGTKRVVYTAKKMTTYQVPVDMDGASVSEFFSQASNISDDSGYLAGLKSLTAPR